MNIRHKLVSISVLALISVQAIFAKDITYGNVTLSLSEKEKTATITNAKDLDEEIVEIPGSFSYENEDYTIVGIGDRAFYKNAVIKEVKLPNSITTLGEYAFGSCTQLKSINIPSSVETMEEGVFYACTNIDSIQFEQKDKRMAVKAYMFYKCEKLNYLPIPVITDSVGAFAFSNCSNLAGDIDLSSVKHIGQKAFYNCKSINKFTLGRHCDFESYAFYNCKSIKEIKITNPNNISGQCFMYCDGMDSVTIEFTHPYELGGIGDSCFIRCVQLNSVKILDYSRYKDSVYHPELSSGICTIGLDVFKYAPLEQGIAVSKDEIDEYKEAEDWKDYAKHLIGIEIRNMAPKEDTATTIMDTTEEVTDTAATTTIDTTDTTITEPAKKTASLEGLRVIVFGDSKAEGVGNEPQRFQYYPWGYYLQEKFGCTVTNVAVGGTHMTPMSLKPQASLNGLGVYSLVQAWKTGDYALVDSSIAYAKTTRNATRWLHVPEILRNTTAKDYDIVCIEAGTNDWNNRLRVIGSWEDTKPIYNFTVAMRTIIESLYEMNPDLYILIIPPIVRQMDVNDTTTYSDYYKNPNSELYLYDLSMGMMEIAKKCNADAIDAYYGMGFNINNWYPENTGDGTHPNEHGYRIMADKIGEFLLKNYFKEGTVTPIEEEDPQSTSTFDYYINEESDTIPTSVYDLNGRIVKGSSDNLKEGYYIINGKKCYIKSNLK